MFPITRTSLTIVWFTLVLAVVVLSVCCSASSDSETVLNSSEPDDDDIIPPDDETDSSDDDTTPDGVDDDDAQADDTEELPDCSDGSGEVITVNPIVEIGGLTRETFWDLRTGYVDDYPFSLYPDPYLITGNNQSQIYGAITWGVGWVEETQFFVENPYVLISTVRPTTVDSLEIYFAPAVTYKAPDCYFHEFTSGAARDWSEWIFGSGSSIPGVVQFYLVNAEDAGFNYAAVPSDRCTNVDPTGVSDTFVDNVVYITRYTYHFGQYSLNNLSPDDPVARVALVDPYADTRIGIKLWRAEPTSIHDKPDLYYQVHVAPGSAD